MGLYPLPLLSQKELELEKEKSLKKVVFIAHPIAGDIAGNMAKVLKICHEVHVNGTIPVAPYLVALQYLNDEVVEDRELGIEANLECFHRRFVDELWLFGDRISAGMWGEIRLAREVWIPVIAKTEGTWRDLKEFETYANA